MSELTDAYMKGWSAAWKMATYASRIRAVKILRNYHLTAHEEGAKCDCELQIKEIERKDDE